MRTLYDFGVLHLTATGAVETTSADDTPGSKTGKTGIRAHFQCMPDEFGQIFASEVEQYLASGH